MQDNTAKSFLDPSLISLMEQEVGKSKDAEEPVNRAFEKIAKKSGLKFNTVRNYYYRYIYDRESRENNTVIKGKSYQKDTSVAGSTFTEKEVKELMMAMLLGQAKGKSVRGCANELAENDKRLMLRYQNKYRNVISRNPEYVKKLMMEMSQKGLIYYDPLVGQRVHGHGDVSASEDELFDNIGRLISNINDIGSPNLDGLLKGLQELSEMAAKYKRQVKEPNRSELLSNIDHLVAINKGFLELTPMGKLTGLSVYIKEMEGCIKEMGQI